VGRNPLFWRLAQVLSSVYPKGTDEKRRVDGVLVPPSVETQLNDRQKQIMTQVQRVGKVTSGWCLDTFGVSYNTAYRDLSDLVARDLLVQRGKGRATRYEINTDEK